MRIDVEQMAMWKRWCLLLWMLPFVFTSAFGEAMHSHPLLVAQSTLVTAEASSAHDHADHHEPLLFQSTSCAKTATECLACLWSAQATTPLSLTASLAVPYTTTSRVSPPQTSYFSPVVSFDRSRGPPTG